MPALSFNKLTIALAVMSVSACAQSQYNQTPYTQYQSATNQQGYSQPAQRSSGYSAQGQHFASFSEWKNDFIRRAASQGYDISRLMANATLNQKVISSDKNQAEFAKMPWAYVDSAVSSSRVSGGRKNYANNRSIFNSIRRNYAVDPEVVAAIWGMESSYGGFTGSANLASSLASLAFEGRRRDFAEKELLALQRILDRGDVRWQAMKGSWAGGMGHTQFIPGTWVNQGVDADRDGRANPWSKTDALNSTANYLTNSGWQAGIDPVYEIQLPRNFNHNLIGSTKSFSQWNGQGIRLLGATGVPGNTQLKLWLPAGINGPALLTSNNFNVIKVYNNSSSYALGVSLLAKEIARRGGLQTSWPRSERPLATYKVQQLQETLTRMGYDTKGADGVIGTNTRKAFAKWQSANGRIPDGFISQRSVRGLLR